MIQSWGVCVSGVLVESHKNYTTKPWCMPSSNRQEVDALQEHNGLTRPGARFWHSNSSGMFISRTHV